MENKINGNQGLYIHNPKYLCPKCGVVEHFIDISIPGLEGKYCQVCYARWIKESFPKVTKIEDK